MENGMRSLANEKGGGLLVQGQLKGKLQVGGKYLVYATYTRISGPLLFTFGAICYCAVSVKPISCDGTNIYSIYIYKLIYIHKLDLHGDTDSATAAINGENLGQCETYATKSSGSLTDNPADIVDILL